MEIMFYDDFSAFYNDFIRCLVVLGKQPQLILKQKIADIVPPVLKAQDLQTFLIGVIQIWVETHHTYGHARI